jgi:hypothetical protein
MYLYRKPPTISPGLIYFRKRFLMGLYKGGLIYGWAYTWTIFCVSNKRILSSDYWAYINWGTCIRGAYIRVGLYSGGLNIWNDVSVSTCGGLIHGGGLYSGGAYSRRFTVFTAQHCQTRWVRQNLRRVKLATILVLVTDSQAIKICTLSVHLSAHGDCIVVKEFNQYI